MRCFIALGTDGSERDSLERTLAAARHFPELAVTPTANLHLTLEFLGELDEDAVARAGEAVQMTAAATPPMELAWAAPGAFPGRARPRVLWLGVDDATGALQALHRRLQEALSARDLPTEERRFRPHLTLARLRRGDVSRPRVEELLAWLDAVSVPRPSAVRSLLLMRSRLGREPAVHEALAEVAL